MRARRGILKFCRWEGIRYHVPRITQAVGPNLGSGLTCLLGQQAAVDLVVAVFEEDGFAAIAALGNMVGKPGDDNAGEARHTEILSPGGYSVSCPPNYLVRQGMRAAVQISIRV
jgi:hypothetical protein